MKKIITFMLIFIFVLSIAGEGGISYARENTPEGYELIDQTSILSFYFNKETHVLALEDRRNGYIWSSALDESLYDHKKMNKLWQSTVKSIFVLKYTQVDSTKCVVQTVTSEGAPSSFKCEKSGNKLLLDYYFTDIKIGLTVEIGIEGDAMVVSIPYGSIKEDGEHGIVSIEVLPFFGAANKSIDGYVLYPDGCGAIMMYRNKDNKPKSMVKYTYYVYGNEKVDMDVNRAMENNNMYNAMLPVFGVKNEGNAFLAITSKGDSDAQINLSMEGYMVDFNRTAFEYTYRHLFDIILSNVQVNSSNIAMSSKGLKADKKLIEQDYEARYVFLHGKEANYSGMANAYRDYLIKSGGIKKAIENNGSIPLAVDFLMGIMEDRLLFDKFITMTSFKQAEEITERFIDKGIEALQVKLAGWIRGGYGKYPINWPPEGRVGGTDGLMGYYCYAKEKNIDLFMQVNFIDAMNGSGGFSKRNDVVYQGNTKQVSDYTGKLYWLNPAASFGMYETFMNELAKCGNLGVAFEETGEIIYHDYNKNYPCGRMQTMAYWEKMLGAASQSRGLAVEGGNAYALRYADRLFGIPADTSEYFFTDEAVPFYQMVVHGLIPYTTVAGNLFHDPVKQKLKWVEYGCMPYYELTYLKSREIKYTNYNSLFTSHYEEWIDTAAGIYKEFNERLGSIWSEYMTGHEKLSNGLVKVSYSNGTVIYINYGDLDVVHGGHIVKAQDYLVLEGGR